MDAHNTPAADFVDTGLHVGSANETQYARARAGVGALAGVGGSWQGMLSRMLTGAERTAEARGKNAFSLSVERDDA